MPEVPLSYISTQSLRDSLLAKNLPPYNVEGSFTYMEGGMGIYGKLVKYNNALIEVNLTHEEVDSISYEEDYYEELMENLLDEKFNKIKKGLAV